MLQDFFQQSYTWATYLFLGQEVDKVQEFEEVKKTSMRKQKIERISKEHISSANQKSSKTIKETKMSSVSTQKQSRESSQSTQKPSATKIESDIQDEEMAAYFVQCKAVKSYINPSDCFKKTSCPTSLDKNSKLVKPCTSSLLSSDLSNMSSKSDLYRVKSMDKISELEKRPTQENYQNLIYFHIKNSQLDQAYELFLDMQTHHLPIDRLVCHALLDAFAKQNKIQKMEALFEKMKKENIRFNEVTYNILIHGYCKNQQLQRALEYKKEMETKGLKPNTITYNILLNAYSMSSMAEQISELLDEMEQNQIVLSRATYNIAINAYMMIGNLDVSSKLFNQSNISLVITYENKLVLLDCHTLSHGSACIGLHHYLKNHMTMRSFCVITGIGKHSKNAKMYQMQNCIREFFKKHYPFFISYSEVKNPGRLYYEKREG